MKIHTENLGEINVRLIIHQGVVMVRNIEQANISLIPFNDSYDFVSRTHVDKLLRHMQKESIHHRISRSAYVKDLRKKIRQVIFHCGRCT